MSNWRRCAPENPMGENFVNQMCITELNIIPNEGAKVKLQVWYQNGRLSAEFVNVGMPDYQEWGTDDEWVYRFCAQKLGLGQIIGDDYVPRATAILDDTRSVHNEADIKRIQTLQEQLDEQAAKLKTITELLFKNGSL